MKALTTRSDHWLLPPFISIDNSSSSPLPLPALNSLEGACREESLFLVEEHEHLTENASVIVPLVGFNLH